MVQKTRNYGQHGHFEFSKEAAADCVFEVVPIRIRLLFCTDREKRACAKSLVSEKFWT